MEYFVSIANWFTYAVAYLAPVVGFGGIVFAVRSYIQLLDGGAGSPSTERNSEVVYTAALTFINLNLRVAALVGLGTVFVMLFSGVGFGSCLVYLSGLLVAALLALSTLLVVSAAVSRFVAPRKQGHLADAFQRAYGGSSTVAVLVGGAFLLCVGTVFLTCGSTGDVFRASYLILGIGTVACLLRIGGEQMIGQTSRHFLSEISVEEGLGQIDLRNSDALRDNLGRLDSENALLYLSVSSVVRTVSVAVEILVLLVSVTVSAMAIFSRMDLIQDSSLFMYFIESREDSYLHALVATPVALALFYYCAVLLGLNAPARFEEGRAWSSLRSLGTMATGLFLGGSLFFILFSGFRFHCWLALCVGVLVSIILLVLGEYYSSKFGSVTSAGSPDADSGARLLSVEDVFERWSVIFSGCMKSASLQFFVVGGCIVFSGIIAGLVGVVFAIFSCLLFSITLLVVSTYGGIVRAGSCVSSLPQESTEYNTIKLERSLADSLELLVREVVDSYWGLALVGLFLALTVQIASLTLGDTQSALSMFRLSWHYGVAFYVVGLGLGLGICSVPFLSHSVMPGGYKRAALIEDLSYLQSTKTATLCLLVALLAGFLIRLFFGMVAVAGFALGALSAGWVLTLLSTHLFSRIAHFGWLSGESAPARKNANEPNEPIDVDPARPNERLRSLILLGGEGVFSSLVAPSMFIAFIAVVIGLLS